MTKKSIYPTRRQKGFFRSYDAGVEQYHLVTSASIMYFRHTFRLIILIYAVFAIVSGFELLSGVLVTELAAKTKIVATSMAALMLVLSVTMGMLHNQILLILGHGYKSHDAQLYVDRLTTKEECSASLKIIKSMYLIAIVISVVMLWFLWGMYGTPLYNGQFSSQINAGSAFLAELVQDSEEVSSAQLFKPYLWTGSLALISTLLIGILGYIQVVIAKTRIK